VSSKPGAIAVGIAGLGAGADAPGVGGAGTPSMVMFERSESFERRGAGGAAGGLGAGAVKEGAGCRGGRASGVDPGLAGLAPPPATGVVLGHGAGGGVSPAWGLHPGEGPGVAGGGAGVAGGGAASATRGWAAGSGGCAPVDAGPDGVGAAAAAALATASESGIPTMVFDGIFRRRFCCERDERASAGLAGVGGRAAATSGRSTGAAGVGAGRDACTAGRSAGTTGVGGRNSRAPAATRVPQREQNIASAVLRCPQFGHGTVPAAMGAEG
jgi:hypothetical protein